MQTQGNTSGAPAGVDAKFEVRVGAAAGSGGVDAPLTLAVGTVDITPSVPRWPSLWMGGYAGGPRGNHGDVARTLRAHCVVFYDQGTPNVLLRADIVHIPRDVHQAVRSRIVDAGLVADSADFMMMASHTHSGMYVGDTTPNPFIMMNLQPADIDAINLSTQILIDLLVQLVTDTLQVPPVAVTLGYAEGNTTIGYNRVDMPTVLSTVPVLLARAVSDNSPVALVFGYACHAVARGNDEVFDSDYCGEAAEQVERWLGVPALFLQGTAGDQQPADPQSPDQVANLGDQLARTIADVVVHGAFTPVTGPFATQLTEVDLPFTVDTSKASVRNQLRTRYQQRVNDNPPTEYVNRHAQVMLGQLDDGTLPTSIPMPIQCWKLGGLTIMGLAHEALSVYDGAVKALMPGKKVWVLGYTNEVACYVPGDEVSWAGGSKHFGYEAGWTDDPTITGENTAPMFFAWPAPLRFSPVGTTPPAVGSTQRIVLDACRTLLTG
ncbi:hypothetical protein F0L68_25480 [Solihabitans fulvus]|uniref:Ceramidase n=1 Tax=Solihabitans fulvus TaxID=1892852 RepID=A0A5B2X1M6_9PSEU|nr:hypothetical protein [Solihabitans fulvus]KAA2257099.1 hypothetical protein F0L68_25480 [Solihabitans fulvus]